MQPVPSRRWTVLSLEIGGLELGQPALFLLVNGLRRNAQIERDLAQRFAAEIEASNYLAYLRWKALDVVLQPPIFPSVQPVQWIEDRRPA